MRHVVVPAPPPPAPDVDEAVQPNAALVSQRERLARDRAAALHAVTAELSRALTPAEVAERFLAVSLAALGGQQAALWIVEPGADAAALVHAVGFSAETIEQYRRVALADASLPLVLAMRDGAPVFVESRAEATERFPDLVARSTSSAASDYAFACLPLEAEGRCLGAASFSFGAARRLDGDERVFLTVLARHAAQAFARARLYDSERAARAAAEAAQRRAVFLAEASAVLASSLEPAETLAAVARLAVPRVADWCAIERAEDLVSGADPLVAHVDPAKVELARAWRRRWPPDPAAPTGAPAVIRTGRAELYATIDDALLVAAARDDEHLRVVRELGMTSAMVVPLSARGRTLGAATFISTRADRRYDADDLVMAEELGRRAGLALDNARLYDEAQRAVRARDDVLAIVSHDLKNPLEAVYLSAALLLRAPESPRVGRHAEIIQRSATRMDRLIRGLLDLSSLDAGRLRVERRPERLEAIAEDVLAMLAPLAAERGVALALEGAPLEDEVPCDRERIAQVLSNLVGNGVQFTPRGGRVVVGLALEPGQARVSVRDTGPGLSPEARAHLFDRFWKSGSRRGTGLGLSIAKGMVEAHGGRIGVASEPGAGATFEFTLPRG